MRGFRVRLTPEAARLIAKLPPEIKRLVRSALDGLGKEPHRGAELSGELAEYRSLKIRRYRIIYRLNEEDSFIEVYHVGHRGDVYETLRALLSRLG